MAGMISGLGLLVIALFPISIAAMPAQEIPNPREQAGNWISDVANILSPDIEGKVNALITKLKTQTGSEMAVVTLPDSQPYGSTKELATELFNRWKIGQAGKDNGVLLVISLGDRRVEIETGYGVEDRLPDAKVGAIIEQRITPAFKAKNYGGGTLAGTEAIVNALEEQTPTKPTTLLPDDSILSTIVIALASAAIGLSAIVVIAGIAWKSRQGPPPRSVDLIDELVCSLKSLTGLAIVLGLRQSIRLDPRQRSRVGAWRLVFERSGSMRCAKCGATLEAVERSEVIQNLNTQERAAEQLGSLQCRGWRCCHCAPEQMHLRCYASSASRFGFCPDCQELTMVKEIPYATPDPSHPGSDLRITTAHCVICNHTSQELETVQAWDGSNGDHGSNSDSGGGGFSGGSSGGGGAGGSW